MVARCARAYRAIGRAVQGCRPALSEGWRGWTASHRPVVQSLESRTLLAVTPADYASIRAACANFNLPADMAQVNVIEITPDQLSVANLKSAITAAAGTTLPDLVVVRTTDTENTITYGSAADTLAIDIPSAQGSISIVGFGTRPLTLDAAGNCGVVTVGSSDSTTAANLGRLTLAGGSASTGGGINQSYGSLMLTNVTISGNTASNHGGGVYQSGGTLALTNVTISGNTATEYGGGVDQSGGTSALTNVTISGNKAYDGGGVYQCSGTSTLANVTISGNTASGYGGGMYLESGTSALTNVTISGNTASHDGGGASWGSGPSTLTNVTINGNTATYGGGVELGFGTSTLTNVTISGNTASAYGGGVCQFCDTSTLTNVTISGNTAYGGGGVYQSSGTSTLPNVTIAGNTATHDGGGVYLYNDGTLTLRNTIVARNAAGNGPDLCNHATLTGANNLIGDGTGQTGLVNGTSGNVVGSAASTIDPVFASMAGTDWTLWNLRLQVGSLAVNRGDNSWIPAGVTMDIARGPRIVGAAVDMGAYELDQAPTDIALSNSGVPEHQPAGTAVGTLSATDPDMGDTFTYSLVGGAGSDDNGSFTISGEQLKTATSVDYESKSSYSVRIRTTDSGGVWFEKTFTIDVTNVNETPTDMDLSGKSVAENQPAGSVMGTLSAIDPDAGDTFTYALVSGTGSDDNGSFTIDGNQFKTAAVLDYESQSSYSVRVRATDAGGLSVEKVFTIGVTDVSEVIAAPLAIIGTAGNDRIVIKMNGDLVVTRVNRVATRMPVDQVASIQVVAGAGDDTVIVNTGVMGVLILGGGGNDTLTGGDGNDTIKGGAGSDLICGGMGDDRLLGQAGEDVLHGGGGNDVMDGGVGRDVMYGQGGADTLLARDGESDKVFGGAGADMAMVDDLLDRILQVEGLLT